VRVPRRSIHIAAAGIAAALLISMATPAFAAPERRVIVLLAPYLTWSDISSSMPNAMALAEKSLVANMNVRAGGIMGASTPDRGALVLSAGAPLNAASGAVTAYTASETVGVTPARDLYLEYFGRSPGDAQVLFPGLPMEVLANSDPDNPAVPGALGSSVHAAGAKTAAIGNGDLGMRADPTRTSRPAGEAASDESGTVDLGDVSDTMLAKDPGSPFGIRANVDAILAEYRRVLADPGVRLVVVDPGDLARADVIASSVASSVASSAREKALRTTDAVLGGIMAGAGPDDAIVVIAQAVVSVTDIPAGYGPAIISDGAGTGVGVSASTHRDGVVTEMDVSDTIVGLLGGAPQAAMVGSPVYSVPTSEARTAADRIAYLDRLNTSSVAVESVRMTTVNYFITLTVLILLGATLVLYRTHDGLPEWLPRAARWVLLVPVAVLLGAVLQFVFWSWPATGNEVIVALMATTALALAVAVLPFRRAPATLPLIVLSGLTAAILMIDQWLGAPLSLFGVFGYSPLLGARYYGLGNEMAGLLLGSAFVAFALVLDTWPDARWTRAMRTWGWPLMGVVVLATAAAPIWGANVGPAAWMTVGFIVGWLMLAGKRVLTWRNLAIGGDPDPSCAGGHRRRDRRDRDVVDDHRPQGGHEHARARTHQLDVDARGGAPDARLHALAAARGVCRDATAVPGALGRDRGGSVRRPGGLLHGGLGDHHPRAHVHTARHLGPVPDAGPTGAPEG
jgi:hypothetical protein